MPVAELFWQVSPGDACPKPIEDRFDKEAIVFGGHADVLFITGQTQRRDILPLLIRQSITMVHITYTDRGKTRSN